MDCDPGALLYHGSFKPNAKGGVGAILSPYPAPSTFFFSTKPGDTNVINRAFFVTVVAASLVGCATGSTDVKSTYISPITYQGYSCDQLREENQRIQTRISELSGNVDKKASGDKVKMGVGLVLFWPALFFLKGDGPETQELARLKGEHDALEQAYLKKSCT